MENPGLIMLARMASVSPGREGANRKHHGQVNSGKNGVAEILVE